MKKNEFKVILTIFLIMVLILVLVIVTKNRKNKNEQNDTQNIKTEQNVENTQNKKEEYVEVKKDGTKVNTSNKLKQEKTVDGLTVSNITITEKDNETTLRATVKNSSNTVKGDYTVKLKIKDNQGNIIKEITGYINTVKANEQTTLSIKTSYDFANAYDFEIVKQ